MGLNKSTLIYQGDKPMRVMELYHYRAGNVSLKKKGDKLIVSDAEKNYLLKLSSGNKSKKHYPLFRSEQEDKEE